MNQIASALVAAGVKVPSQSRRIWSFLKDHPDITAVRLSQALSIKLGSVTSLLAQMAAKNRVESHARKTYASGKMRTVGHWKAIGASYDEPPRKIVVATVAPPQKVVELPRKGAADVVDVLTVAQARELWVILNRMFGEQK